MGCNNNLSNMCLDPIKATCVDYEGNLGSNTTIVDDCVNQDMVNVDVYTQLDSITVNISTALVGTGGGCGITTTNDTVGNVLRDFEDEICDLGSRTNLLENKDYGTLDITGFGLDFKCLVDPCGDPIVSLGQLLQIMIDKDCAV